MTAQSSLFQCTDGDFEGHLSGAMHHAGLTGHTLTLEKADGTVITVSLQEEDEQ